jgi:hypothetical protein
VAVRVLSTDPPDLRASGVPGPLADVIERAMARDATRRYQTAAELRDALRAIDLDPRTGAATQIVPAPTVVATPRSPTEPALAPTAPVAVAPGPPLEPSSRRSSTRRPRRGQGWVLVALLLLVLAVAAATLLLGDDGEPASAPTTTSGPEVTATSEPSDAGADAVTTTVAPEASADQPTAETDPEGAVRSYYSLMDAGRIDEGFARLSPAYQERTGEASYHGFWETVAGVEVLEVRGEGHTATATLLYRLRDGSTSRERVTLRFVDAPDGTLLIDDYRTG